MDGLSGAGSVIAVVSVAIQLAETIKKIYDFWSSVQDAPQDIRDIVKELQIILDVIKEIENDEWISKLESHSIIQTAAESCLDKVQSLYDFVGRFGSQGASSGRVRRTWSSIKVVLQKDKIENFKRSIEATKSTLTMVLSLVKYDAPSI